MYKWTNLSIYLLAANDQNEFDALNLISTKNHSWWTSDSESRLVLSSGDADTADM